MTSHRKSLWATCALVVLGLVFNQVVAPVWQLEAQSYRAATAKPYLAAHASGWVAIVVDWLGPFWLGVGSTLAALVGFEVIFGVLAKRRRSIAPPALVRTPPIGKPIPPDAPIARMAAMSEAIVHLLTESPKPKPLPAPVPPEPKPDWSRIFELSEDGRDIRLSVVPDGEDVAGHTLLLVLYGYRVLKSYTRVSVPQAVGEAIRALREAPNAPFASRALPILGTIQALEPEKFGLGILSRGEAERIALRAGGAYELTSLGLDHADELARDLIRRA